MLPFEEVETRIPDSHFISLANFEQTYWWHLTRVERAYKIIKKFFPDAGSINCVDIGCGAGGFLHLLDEKLGFRERLGVDRSPKAVELARRLDPRYQTVDDNFTPPSDTNLVFLMDVLEHINSDEEFLSKLLASMAIGAGVLISVPAYPFLFSQWDQLLGHHRRYTASSLRKLCKASGGNIQYFGYGFSYLFPAAIIHRVIMERVLARQSRHVQQYVFPPVPRWLNQLLCGVGRVEASVGNLVHIPFGLSLYCLLKK
ncbi:MAG: class I SAM-dependent methyltransferase [Pseudomonadota bacterium]|nr:class I SAM-dependent methyltransferase [Pseudomonadota bacterium]